jgi:hypothetical protein
LVLGPFGLGAGLPSGSAAAQEEPPEPGVIPASEPTDSEFDEPRSDRLELRLHLERATHDNFFRLPDGEEGDDTTVDRAQLRLLWSLVADGPYRVFLEGQETSYEDLPSARALVGGFRFDGERHFVEVKAEIAANRAATDVEDDPDPADVERFDGAYDVRLSKSWQVGTSGRLEQRTHDAPGRDSELLDLDASLRWRGYGSLFSPEVGLARGRKTADRQNEEYTQRDLFARLRSRPTDRLYLSLRYRYRERDYDVASLVASNFGREDARDEWTFRADVTAAQFAILNLEYVWMNGDSSRAEKSFTSSELTFGVTFLHRYRPHVAGGRAR